MKLGNMYTVRLGVNFVSWFNFWMLVWLSLSWMDFVKLSDIIRMYGHVVDDVITLWWSRGCWYDFSPSWLKFSFWCDFICLDVIDWILVWFFFVLAEIWVLVWFCLIWCCFISWCEQMHLGMIFICFGWLFRLSVFLSDLGVIYILVRLTASWCDLCVLDGDIFLYISFYSCM